jgi:hypothetical protein
MKPILVAGVTVLAVGIAAAARAQTVPPPPSPVARADAWAMIGWFNADKSDATHQSYNDWYNSSVYGGAGLGWYWTDHHKTEIDFGATSEGDIYASRSVVVDGYPTYTSSRVFFTTKKLALSQQYQAFRNAWFHPHVAAGVDLTWETTREEQFPTIRYDDVTRGPREIRPGGSVGPETELVVRPFISTGFKAYMSQKSFFRTDVRLTLGSGVEEALWRVGFGFDF